MVRCRDYINRSWSAIFSDRNRGRREAVKVLLRARRRAWTAQDRERTTSTCQIRRYPREPGLAARDRRPRLESKLRFFLRNARLAIALLAGPEWKHCRWSDKRELRERERERERTKRLQPHCRTRRVFCTLNRYCGYIVRKRIIYRYVTLEYVETVNDSRVTSCRQ